MAVMTVDKSFENLEEQRGQTKKTKERGTAITSSSFLICLYSCVCVCVCVPNRSRWSPNDSCVPDITAANDATNLAHSIHTRYDIGKAKEQNAVQRGLLKSKALIAKLPRFYPVCFQVKCTSYKTELFTIFLFFRWTVVEIEAQMKAVRCCCWSGLFKIKREGLIKHSDFALAILWIQGDAQKILACNNWMV